MVVSSIAPWYGSKRTLAPEIIAEFGPHKSYWEPFCGSMAVLLAKPPAGMETVNDLHSDLINLARVLASDRCAELYHRCQRSLMHGGLFDEAKAECFGGEIEPPADTDSVGDEHVHRAWCYLVMSWQGRNGNAGTKPTNITLARRYTHNGGSGGLRWQSAVDSIPAWHQRLRSVVIVQDDGLELLGKIADQPGVVIYVDPPYFQKSTKYLHDFTLREHVSLAEALERFRHARVIVSYYDDPRLERLYSGWTVRKLQINKGLRNANARGPNGSAAAAPEVLLINGPSLVETNSVVPAKGKLF